MHIERVHTRKDPFEPSRSETEQRVPLVSLISLSFLHFILTEFDSLFFLSLRREFRSSSFSNEETLHDGSFQREEKRNPTIERVESSKITRNGKARSDVQGEGTSTRGGRRVERVRERRYCSLSRTFNATAGVFTSVERTSRVNKIMQLLLFCTPGILD